MVGYLEFGLVSGGVFQFLSETVELHLQLVHPTGLHSQHLHLLRIQREGEREERWGGSNRLYINSMQHKTVIDFPYMV